MKLSIVTTMYRSAPYLREFYERVSGTAKKISDDYEIIFVNDGSPDDSLELVLSLYEEDDKIRVVDLSRNFGHHRAVMTGLSYATGDIVFLIDCDLEEDPENLETFYDKFRNESDCDVVYGVQNRRKGNFISRLAARLFYKLLNTIMHENLDSDMVFSRLMSRRYVKSLLEHKERELFLVGLWHITGYKQLAVSIPTRYKGSSSYTTGRKVALALNGMISFSDKPLLYISYLGAFIFLISAGFILYFILRKFIWGVSMLGWASLIVSIWFIGGMVMISIGVVGIYLSKVFIETKARPYSIVKKLYSRNPDYAEIGKRDE